jgi:hypothetical protein
MAQAATKVSGKAEPITTAPRRNSGRKLDGLGTSFSAASAAA